MLEASPNAVVAVDERGQIIYVNPQVATTFGYRPDELLGRPVETLLPTDAASRHEAHREGFVAHPVARPMGIGLDLAGRRKDGTRFPVEISLVPVPGPDGPQVFATIVDITARKAVEAAVLEAQKLESVGRLAGGLAHDFNNMLFAISMSADLLAEDHGDDGNVGVIRDATERAMALTSQLMAISRQQVIRPMVVDVAAAVRDLEPMLRSLVGEGLRLDLRLDESTGYTRIDPGQLDQVVVNLIVNARDATPDGGGVTIATGPIELGVPRAGDPLDLTPGHYVSLDVSDTGMGMDRATRERAFEPFFTTKAPGRGTGLGLATSYGIVRQAGGHITIDSEPGRGATFRLYLPAADPLST